MNKICTSVEQSKKLIELGINVNTADMFWTYDFVVNDINGLNVILDNLKPEENDIPAWSLSALFKLLPIFTEPTAFSVNVSVPSVTKTDNGWLSKYDGDFTLNMNNGKDTEAPVEFLADNSIDAAFELVCWLKETNRI